MKRTNTASAETYRKSFQSFLYFLQMPMSVHKLSSLPMGTLRVIAKQFKAYDGEEMRGYNRNELVRFICGHQNEPEQYLPIEKLPGIDYPDLEDQKFRQMFASKVDPWKRLGVD